MNRATHRLIALLCLCVLPLWAAAAGNYGFTPPRSADDPAAETVMRDLAQRLIPVYQEADNDLYLANLTAMQVVSGAYGAAWDSSQTLRDRHQGKPMDSSYDRAVIDAIYARARALEANDHVPFSQAYTRSFQDVVQPLDDQRAADIMARLAAPLATYRQPVQEAFDRWRPKGSIPEADAVALVRTWLIYESRRSYAVLIPALVASEEGRRYSVETDVAIPVRGRTVIHATIVRSTSAQGPLPVLLRYTLDPDEDDARRSAMRGYVGITAYARGRTPDGKGAVWPFVHDGDDAKAVIDWIARQAWCDGRVAMLGDGYSGYVAWAAARKQPAALKAIATIAPMAPGIDFPMAGQIYRNTMARWVKERAQSGPVTVDPNDAARWRALDEAWYRKGQPYREMDRIFLGQRNRLLRTWLTHPSHDRYWQKFLPSARQFAQIDIPVLTIGGYFGGADAGALYYHQEHLRQRPKADDTLVAGPYDAGSIRNGTAATLRGMPIDAAAQVDLQDLCYRWFDHLFKSAPKPPLLQGRVNMEAMGANEWRHADTLAATDRTSLRLHLDTRQADGPHKLLTAPAGGDGDVPLTVDLGDRRDVGQPWTDALRLAQLPTRNGVSFVGEPLAKDTEIAGGLRGVLDITPSRQDVDLTVALYAQLPGGGYQLLFDPYDFRASYAGDRVHRRLLRAGERQLLPFATERITAMRLPAGSRIVLVLAINKRLDRQINAGSGKAVNAETIADAKPPMRVRWHAGSYVEIGSGRPQ